MLFFPLVSLNFFFFFFSFWLCCAACGILAPRPGIEPRTPAVEVQSPNHWTAREFPQLWLLVCAKVGNCQTDWLWLVALYIREIKRKIHRASSLVTGKIKSQKFFVCVCDLETMRKPGICWTDLSWDCTDRAAWRVGVTPWPPGSQWGQDINDGSSHSSQITSLWSGVELGAELINVLCVL